MIHHANRSGRLVRFVFLLGVLGATVAASEIQVWNYPVLDNAQRKTERGDLAAMRIVATRNGTFSGAVAVEAAEGLSGLQASLSGVADRGGSGAMPSSSDEAVQVRYAVAWQGGRGMPPNLDILLEAPPEAVSASDNRALVGIWVTVTVSEDMAPGMYHGDLLIEANGQERTVAVELEVAPWILPDTQDWRIWVEMIQSPDTLAHEYEVPFWSDRHFELIAESFRRIKQTGSRVVYIHMISQTNQGNEQSMVRWIRKADGSLEPDYTVVERYLDVAQENLGDLKLVVFYAWDAYLAREFRGRDLDKKPTVDESASKHVQAQQRRALAQWELRQQGLTVTIVDEATGEVEAGHLPHYWVDGSVERWKPVYTELRERMRRRGLDDIMRLGTVTDLEPARKDHEFFAEVTGGLPWIAHSHFRRTNNKPMPNTILRGIAPLAYEAHAYDLVYTVNPAVNRSYGWQVKELRAYLCRFGLLNGHPLVVRQMPMINITGRQRGVGRLAGDLWPALRDKRGRRAGRVFDRYPHNHWRGLNINNWFLAPGVEGPVGTVRFENLREGVQEGEARIFIESALLDETKRAALGDDLAERAQAMLDERQLALWRAYWPNDEQLAMLGTISGRSMHEAIWGGLSKAGVDMPGFWDGSARRMRSEMGRDGRNWFVDSDWLDRNRRLFAVAAEVADALQ